MSKRKDWIDILRAVAICAVVIDHGIFLFFASTYRQNIIWQHTYFSITWFIFLSAITNTLSAQKDKWTFPMSYLQFWVKRSVIVFPYFFANTVIYLAINFPRVELAQFLHSLLFFSLQPTYYFINLIMQLYFIFPFLYHLLSKCNSLGRKIIYIILMLSATLIILKIKPVGILSVPGYLFGGTYFFIFALGLLYTKINLGLNPLFAIASIMIFTGYEYILLSGSSGFSTNLATLIWSVSLLIVVRTALREVQANYLWVKILTYLGRHSLFIYLFHYFFLLMIFYRRIIVTGFELIIILISAVCLSLLMEYLYQFIYKGLIKVFRLFSIILRV